MRESLVSIPAGRVALEGALDLPAKPSGLVVFSHGSGSGRHSPRNQFVAAELRRAGLATLLLDLLTPEEDQDYETRFDIDLLTERLGHAVRFVRSHPQTRGLCRSDCSARAPAPRPRCASRRRCPTRSAPSSRAADGPI